jgi:arginase
MTPLPTRRQVLALIAALIPELALAKARNNNRLSLILAPSNLGLRPEKNGDEPGTWRAPEVLMGAGLPARLGTDKVIALDRPSYEVHATAGTRIRNGLAIQRFSLELGQTVGTVIRQGLLPIVIGGDCSVLLGCLYGARTRGGRGLVHIDGHSDFFHPDNDDTGGVLGAAAGMDLALATGRGESLLTEWPELQGPLSRDEDTIQIGERNALAANFSYGDIVRTKITRLIIQDVLRNGVSAAAQTALDRMYARGLDRAWMFVDLDVLDQSAMPAVDSPGTPGLDLGQLSLLMGVLLESRRFLGACITIYDPARDPKTEYAGRIVATLGDAFDHLR